MSPFPLCPLCPPSPVVHPPASGGCFFFFLLSFCVSIFLFCFADLVSSINCLLRPDLPDPVGQWVRPTLFYFQRCSISCTDKLKIIETGYWLFPFASYLTIIFVIYPNWSDMSGHSSQSGGQTLVTPLSYICNNCISVYVFFCIYLCIFMLLYLCICWAGRAWQ